MRRRWIGTVSRKLRPQVLVCVSEPEFSGRHIHKAVRNRRRAREAQADLAAFAALQLEGMDHLGIAGGARDEAIRAPRQRGRTAPGQCGRNGKRHPPADSRIVLIALERDGRRDGRDPQRQRRRSPQLGPPPPPVIMTLELGGQPPRLLVPVQLPRQQEVLVQEIGQPAPGLRAIAVENQRRLVLPLATLERALGVRNQRQRSPPQLLPPRAIDRVERLERPAPQRAHVSGLGPAGLGGQRGVVQMTADLPLGRLVALVRDLRHDHRTRHDQRHRDAGQQRSAAGPLPDRLPAPR